jgi:hypothetical protein
MKLGPISKAVILVVLAVAVLAAVRFLDRIPARRLAALLGVTVTVSDPMSADASPSPSVLVQPLSSQVSALSLGTVAIQTFSGSTLVRTGSGTIVSSDGLIITTAAVAPYGSGSYIYQVAIGDGRLLRASYVWRDGSGLALLRVAATDLNTVPFDQNIAVYAGSPVTLVGAFLSLSRYTPVIMPAVIPYAADIRDIPLSVDRLFAARLVSARVVDEDGRSIGLVQLAGAYPRMISAAVINTFVDRYLFSVNAKK